MHHRQPPCFCLGLPCLCTIDSSGAWLEVGAGRYRQPVAWLGLAWLEVAPVYLRHPPWLGLAWVGLLCAAWFGSMLLLRSPLWRLANAGLLAPSTGAQP